MLSLSQLGPSVEFKTFEEFDCKTPGVYLGVPEFVYHACKAVSSSFLKKVDECPAKAYYGEDEDKDPTDAQVVGSGIHQAVLEPGFFKMNYRVLRDDINLRTKAGRAERDELFDKFGREFILTKKQNDIVTGCAESVMRHPEASALLSRPSYRELTVLFMWKGVLCKARLDCIVYDNPCLIVDLKSTRDARPEKFNSDAWKFGYHIQAAMYMMAARWAGFDPKGYRIVAIEKSRPYVTGVFDLDTVLPHGEATLESTMDNYVHYVKTNYWPGYEDGASSLSPPAWA